MPSRDDDEFDRQEDGHERPAPVVLRSFRSTVGRESTTFGFSILVTVTFGVVQDAHGPAENLDLLLYAAGAVLSFTALEAVLSRGFTAPMPQHRSRVVTLGTGLNIISVLAGVGAAMLVAQLLATDIAWLVCPLVAGGAYLALESLEEALGERLLKRRGDEAADEVDR